MDVLEGMQIIIMLFFIMFIFFLVIKDVFSIFVEKEAPR